MNSGWYYYANIGSSMLTNVPLWWGMLIMGEALQAGMGAGGLQEISVSSSQFCCELKIAPQIKAVENITKVGELTNIQELPIKQFLKYLY